eukprot:tig00000459_g1145.t1
MECEKGRADTLGFDEYELDKFGPKYDHKKHRFHRFPCPNKSCPTQPKLVKNEPDGPCRKCWRDAKRAADPNWAPKPRTPLQVKKVCENPECKKEIKRVSKAMKWAGGKLCHSCTLKAKRTPQAPKEEKCRFWFCRDKDIPEYVNKQQAVVGVHRDLGIPLCTNHSHDDFRWASLVCKLFQVINRRLGGSSLTRLLDGSREIITVWHKSWFIGENWRRFFDSPPNKQPIFDEPSPFDGDLSGLSVIENKPLVPLSNFKERVHTLWMTQPPTDKDLVDAIAAAVDGSLFDPKNPSPNRIIRGLQYLIEWWKPAPEAIKKRGERKQKEWDAKQAERETKRKAEKEARKAERAKKRKGAPAEPTETAVTAVTAGPAAPPVTAATAALPPSGPPPPPPPRPKPEYAWLARPVARSVSEYQATARRYPRGHPMYDPALDPDD